MDYCFLKYDTLFYSLNPLHKSSRLFEVYVLSHECVYIHMNLCVLKYDTQIDAKHKYTWGHS